MSTFVRKLSWPAALVAGMLVLLAALGVASTPAAEAADGDICAISGPFPADPAAALADPTLLEEGGRYLFLAMVEDWDFQIDTLSVEVDDESGDLDITSYAVLNLQEVNGVGLLATEADGYFTISGTDVVANISVANQPVWDAGNPDLLSDLQVDFAFVLDETVCGGVQEVDGFAIFDVTCDDAGRAEITAYDPSGPDNSWTEEFDCWGAPFTMEIAASKTTVESYPAPGNTAHSVITATFEDNEGNPAYPGDQVDWTATGCLIEALDFVPSTPDPAHVSHTGLTGSSSEDTFLYDPPPSGGPLETRSNAILHCEGAAPGTVTVTAEIEREGDDLTASVDITVIGPPAFITMTAAPSEVVCGEKATILITVTDALNQNVSDHTRVELITNYGGVLGGTGASLVYPGVNSVNPLSSSAAETFGGVATAYLLTSTTHIGAYEVVAAAGGSYLNTTTIVALLDQQEEDEEVEFVYYGPDTPPVVSQVTVTCTEAAAPEVTAPDTGTGSIAPPNTGDAGLAAPASGTASLFVIAGAVAFVLAGLASFRFARR